jgi:hypothetical protein
MGVKSRQDALIEQRVADAADIQARVRASRMQTLANRITQRRRNEAALDINAAGGACTAQTVRCGEARIPILPTPECCKAHIRRIMADVAALMDRDGIRWWLDYGTLLGHEWRRIMQNMPGSEEAKILARELEPDFDGLISWDKDGDLGVFGHDREKLLALQPELLGMGYHATYAAPKPAERFRTGDRMKVRISNRNHTNIDLFIWYPDKPKKGWLDRKNYIGADLYKGRDFPMKWAFPLTRSQWEGIDVSLPAEPARLAEHRYGANWRVPTREKHPPEVRP